MPYYIECASLHHADHCTLIEAGHNDGACVWATLEGAERQCQLWNHTTGGLPLRNTVFRPIPVYGSLGIIETVQGLRNTMNGIEFGPTFNHAGKFDQYRRTIIRRSFIGDEG